MGKQIKKSKKRNHAKRKDPAFAACVRAIAQDCLLTLEELTAGKGDDEIKRDDKGRVLAEKCDLPDETTMVDTLNGCWVFSDERLLRHVGTMEKILREFKDEFFDSENGETILDLRRDKKNRVWADDHTILSLCYTAIAMNLAIWTYTRKEWAILEQGMPFIKFTFDKVGKEVIAELNPRNSEVGENHASTN